MSTIQTDVATNDFNDGGDAADAFSSLWGLDAEGLSKDTIDEPKKKTKQEEPAEDEATNEGAEGDDKTSEQEDAPEDEDDAEGKDEGDDGEGDEDDKEGDETPTVEIKDDHKFKVTVDGEDREFTLGSLKRLAGQEASLTRKSQEVATARKQVDATAATHVGALKVLLDRAKAQYEPFAKIDFDAELKNPNVSREEYVAVRNAAQAAHENVKFLESELGTFTQSASAAGSTGPHRSGERSPHRSLPIPRRVSKAGARVCTAKSVASRLTKACPLKSWTTSSIPLRSSSSTWHGSTPRVR
jgi:hypothetical protein